DSTDPLIKAFRATDHRLHFSVAMDKRAQDTGLIGLHLANRPENMYQALVPAPLAGSRLISNQTVPAYASATNVYNSHQGEVAYFLVSTGQTANGTPLFKLMRRLRLAVPNYLAVGQLISLGDELNTDAPATPPAYRIAGTEPADCEVSCKNDPVTAG